MATYSFQDFNIIFSHPSKGQKILNGEGLGSVNVNKTQTKTVHEVAADGSVMVSKIPGENGTIAITLQQINPAHRWLQEYYNYVVNAAASEWAEATIYVESKSTSETHNIIGVSPEKASDKAYQAQGQNVTWNFLGTEVGQMGF